MSTTPSSYRIEEKPFYLPISDEVDIFERAWAEQIPLLLKGPTGCGKTRFIEYMAWSLGQKLVRVTKAANELAVDVKDSRAGVGSLYTVACHEDLTVRDLTGRYIMKGGEAVWIDRAAKDYIAHLYGNYHYTVINDVAALPERLARLYLRFAA